MPPPGYRTNYRVGLLACVAGVLLMCIGIIRFWPVDVDRSPRVNAPFEDEVVQLEAVAQTRQDAAPPPPPEALAPPISVPDAVTPSNEPLDLDVTWRASAPTNGTGPSAGAGRDSAATPRISGASPQPVHFAEPTYPRDAWKERLGAQVVVKVHVSAQGRAASGRIIARYRLHNKTTNRSVSAACCSRHIMERELAKSSDRFAVEHLGHGLEEAALGAAWKWRFRPPTEDGDPLPSYAVLTFTFGR